MLKCLSIQIQPSIDSSHNEAEVIERAKSLGCFPEVDVIEEADRFVDFEFFL